MHGLHFSRRPLPLAILAYAAASTPAPLDLNSLRLTSNTEYVNSIDVNANQSVTVSADEHYTNTAARLVQTIVPGASFRLVDDHYVGDNGVAHVYFRQTAHGIDIDNADCNVNIERDGQLLSFGHSFYTGALPSSYLDNPNLSSPVAALRGARDVLQLPLTIDNVSTEAADGQNKYTFRQAVGAVSDPTAKLVYLVKPDGTLALTWRIETDMYEHWLLTYIDAETTTVHGVVDYVADATYQVYPWGTNDPTEGHRAILANPWDLSASEYTWVSDGQNNYTTTRGNNAIAHWNPTGGDSYLYNLRPSNPDLNFQWPYSPNMSPPRSYINASIVQLFYTANTYHDLLYTLGFTEFAGNFQWNNSGRGGRDKDYVILNAQDGSGYSNANFATPPDGIPGRMRMYIWIESTPSRDGSFDAGIVIHEYTHGVSNRLTGGSHNAGCLNTLESGGMGEGWGDFMATAIRIRPNDTRRTSYTMGAWADNDKRGVRDYPYSTSFAENPLNYTSVNTMNGVHAIGTVWATMLYEVMWNLIDKYGKNDGPRPVFRDGVPTDGKYLMMKLVVDGMALQPCNPNFVQARDAILDADIVLTGGKNRCEIWRGFAKRGLGQGAGYSGGGGFSRMRRGSTLLPRGC
ncbi:extracellular elastinolytic metallo proteinase [Aspergillus eucalypticola CBS 122712]|uniref:Extracellular metalloproteinase n=1 Tax=Aspergillus eucalypticola (strain CBS 122712 / IBT 29274) TaxID=1448314 RepID=A0A317WG65_ASPEC|nr:extracellular elastinolytic metallo proteinase [Aspergillus eucalypticola CBS 122712]PWY85466.1 extracellular elastinolytic metallo proteinase [Aspergillus eucalypticola CBS 122712]